jgi:predicted metal-binding protein
MLCLIIKKLQLFKIYMVVCKACQQSITDIKEELMDCATIKTLE